MPVVEPVIRPPAEAESFLLQVTEGCSANDCTFCGAYLNKAFRVKPRDEVFQDIEKGARFYPGARKIFLMDGDALVLNNQQLVPILERIERAFPKISRVSSYANGYNIVGRSLDELKHLAAHKLSLLYMGLESGCQKILDQCRKKSSAAEMIEAVNKADEAGIKTSIIVLLGLGGRKGSTEHVRQTIDALNRMQPRFLSFLSLMLVPGTPLYEEAKSGAFEELGARELLQEAYDILSGLNLNSTIFRANHASNYFALEGRLPRDKDLLLKQLQQALTNKKLWKPENFRGL